jgi:hypothetical protein
MIDIVVKQQSTSQSEYDFLTECFDTEAERKIFLFREPKGWLRSTRKKFDVSDAKATHMYLRDLAHFRLIGGRPVRYQDLGGYLKNVPELRDVSLEPFEPRDEPSIAVPDEMVDVYEDFLETSYSKPWTARRNFSVSEVE